MVNLFKAKSRRSLSMNVLDKYRSVSRAFSFQILIHGERSSYTVLSGTVKYSVVKTGMDEIGQLEARKGAQSLRKKLVDMASLYIPEGHTVESVTRYYEARRQAIEAGRHAATASLTDLPEPTDIVDDDVKDGENATQDEESLIPASVEEKAVKSAEQLLTIQWKKPAKHTLKLRREAKASGKAYEERKKTWGSAQKQP